MDPGKQFFGVKRLRKVVVCARAQTNNAVDRISPRCQHENWYLGGLPESAQNLETIHSRQHNVEYDQRKRLLQSFLKSGVSVFGRLNRETFRLQILAQYLGQFDVIVDDKYCRSNYAIELITSTAKVSVLGTTKVVPLRPRAPN